MNQRFVILGGHVAGHDGRPTFVPATELVRLYGLNPAQCILANSGAQVRPDQMRGRILLRPVAGGDYDGALRQALLENR